MEISVQYDETDIAKLLSQIIVHPNAEEFVKLFTFQLGSYPCATKHLFKLHLGHKLFEPFVKGTLCYLHHQYVSYSANIQAMKNAGVINDDGLVIVQVMDFRGYHENSNYVVTYDNIVNGKREKGNSWCNHNDLKIIEEF